MPAPAARDWRFWALLGLFLLLLAVQLAMPQLDSDQAVTGLMGVHILKGEFPLFYWRQDHAGVPESYGAAVTFFLFGISRRALSLVPALAAVGLVLAVYRTGAVLFGHAAGLLAMLFTTVVSAYVAANYVLARAYYVDQLLAGQVVLLGVAVWLVRGPGMTDAARGRLAIAIGLAGGLGLYMNLQIVDVLVPAVIALLLADPRLPLRPAAWLGLGAFLIGSTPFWLYNLTHEWATLRTGARFSGTFAAAEAAQILFLDKIPILLGVRADRALPPHLPGPAAWTAPTIVGGAFLLLGARVATGLRRLRRDPALAGEALLLAVVVVTLGLIWYGRFIRVPRYLLPLVPVLALVLARAVQLTSRRSGILAALVTLLYLGAVGIDLVTGLPLLSPRARSDYRAQSERDAQLLAFLRDQDLRHVYSFEYWLAPRLTFDAREEIIVAQPFNDRYPPYTRVVDASPRPAYLLQGHVERFVSWVQALQATAEYRLLDHGIVVWGFTPPPTLRALPRRGWTLSASPGRGDPEAVIDGGLTSGWASAVGEPGSAWIEVDLGEAQPVAGVTLVSDRPDRLPRILTVTADDGRSSAHRVALLDTGGLTVTWRNHAPRVEPGRTLTVRFPRTVTRRLRLADEGPGGAWAVAELFVLAPAQQRGDGGGAARLVDRAHRLEATGEARQALYLYREAMRQAPDDPDGYAEFARLGSALGVRAGSLAQQADRLAAFGLVDDARATYAELARVLGPARTSAALARREARLLAAVGDADEARRREADAAAVLAPRHPVGIVFGRAVELLGHDATPAVVRAGEALEITYHWRLRRPLDDGLVVRVHLRGPAPHPPRLADDHPLPPWVPGLGTVQEVAERRRLVIPATAPPGRYELSLGVRDPASGRRLRRFWHGFLPTLQTSVELHTVEVLPGR